MDIVDQTHLRPLVRNLGQQAEHRQTDQEAIRWRSFQEAEGARDRIPLRGREPLGLGEHRGAEQVLHAGQHQLGLRLHARGSRHPKPLRLLRHVVHQHRLSYAGLATKDQH